jgi:hypothetical protein
LITLKMGSERALMPGDPIGRRVMGWSPGLSEQECWQRTRGVWPLNENRVLSEEFVLVVDPDWIVRSVATITGVKKCGTQDRAIEGDLIRGHPLIGTASPATNRSRNCVGYFAGNFGI